jgi:hypothetical protein
MNNKHSILFIIVTVLDELEDLDNVFRGMREMIGNMKEAR